MYTYDWNAVMDVTKLWCGDPLGSCPLSVSSLMRQDPNSAGARGSFSCVVERRCSREHGEWSAILTVEFVRKDNIFVYI